ncbi:hypothetical protein ACIO6U_19980 [Streptomyces sp. NPDC087422]|uniref:hypothetical protein n=1 Tax=Streptomyces sp. NPDC087422 TaxID=3365786 RepID=UPI0038256972
MRERDPTRRRSGHAGQRGYGRAGRTGGRHEWLGLTLLALPTPLVATDMTSLFLALPRVTADLGASGVQQRMSGAPPDAVPAAVGRTLAGATAASDRLPPGPAAEPVRTARSPFTAGVNLTGVSATGVDVRRARSSKLH